MSMPTTIFEFQPGDRVRKTSGYEFSGVVVSAFATMSGKDRYVVECTVPGAGGMLHIYNASQLEHHDEQGEGE